MNQVRAARESVDLINKRLNEWTIDWGLISKLPLDLQAGHLTEMVEQMEADVNPQGGTFSEGKLGRWLGWIQAAGCAMGTLSLDDNKEINKRWSDK